MHVSTWHFVEIEKAIFYWEMCVLYLKILKQVHLNVCMKFFLLENNFYLIEPDNSIDLIKKNIFEIK